MLRFVRFLLTQFCNKFLDEAVFAVVVVRVVLLLAAAAKIIPRLLSGSLRRAHVDFDARLADSASGVYSSGDFLAHGPLQTVAVDRMPSHVYHPVCGDFVAKPFLVYDVLLVSDRSRPDFLDFCLGQRVCRVGNVVPPTRILLEVLVVVPGFGVP